jgi:hypothetical protein
MISVGFPSQVDIAAAVTTRKKRKLSFVYGSLKRYRSKFCVILTRELVDRKDRMTSLFFALLQQFANLMALAQL